jgi:acetyl-CoA C-acetyltransferase
MREVVVCAPVCTAGRTWNGSLKATPATEPGATDIREAFRRTKL